MLLTTPPVTNCEKKSGIYEISCKDCYEKYVGQTRRSLETRFKDHMGRLKYRRIDISSVAQYALENTHRINKVNKNVSNRG